MAWLSGWEHRLKLTVADTNVDSDLTNFPLLVYLSAASGVGDVDVSAVFDELTSDGNRKKIAITTSDGLTQCYVEIERWDDANEKAWLWVKVPSVLASGGAVLYLYYDSSHADNTDYVGDTTDAVTHNVWDSNFVGVWHMAQDPNGDAAGAIKDSTSNGYHGTPSGSMTTADLVAGLIGDAIEFDGSNDYIATTCPGVLGANDRTVEAIFYVVTSAIGALVWWGDNGTTNGYKWVFRVYESSPFSLRTENTGGNEWATTDARSAWNYGASVFTGTTLTDVVHYLNGAGDGTTSGSAQAVNTDSTNPVNFARQYAGSNYYLGCKICEVRISNVARSAAWIKATHYSNTDAIITFASEASWLGTWNKRIELTIADTNVDSDLTNFPVLVYISAASGIGDVDASAVFDELTSDANRKKIAVTTSDGQTQCYVEIERWVDADETAWLWVKVPSILASGGATLYLYYDAAASDNTTYVGDTGSTPGQTVWDSNFLVVLHMGQDPDGDPSDGILDSTSNELHATPRGSMTTADWVAGAVGKALDLDASNDGLDLDLTGFDATNPFTIEQIFWIKNHISYNWVFCEQGTGNNNNEVEVYGSAGVGSFAVSVYNSTTKHGGTYNLSTGAWLHTALCVDSTSLLYYLNSAVVITDDTMGMPTATASVGYIGTRPGFDYFADIKVDSFRLSSIKRSAAWIKATYYSNTDAIVTFGSELVYGSASSTETVELTEVLGVTLGLSTVLTVKESITVANVLGVTLGLTASKVGFFATCPEPMNCTFSLVSGVSPVLVGRDLWKFNSYVTKILERDSAVEKITSKQSRITKLFDRDSSVR